MPPKDPAISIVTICKDSAATIRTTIDSVVAERDYLFEYIIVDGNSRDGTQDIVRSYGGQVDTFVSEPDDGVSAAFNKGIALATGKIIGLINSDDVLLPGTLHKVAGYFAAHPSVDVLHGDVLLYDGNVFIKRLKPAGRWWYPWRLVLFNHPATFVRREVYLHHGGFDTNYRVAMDVEIFLRWIRHNIRIEYLPQALVRMGAGGVSGRCALLGYREARRALACYGYPAVPASIQYLARVVLQRVVAVQEKLRAAGTKR